MNSLDVIVQAGIVTSRYAGFDRDAGVPVRISVGEPKFWRQGELEVVDELAPHERIFWRDGVSHDEMIAAYEQRLAQHGSAAIAKLAAVARKRGGPLVLLCFEDVNAGEECHRRWFATWFERRTGLVVPELPVERGQLRLDLGQ